MKKEISFNNRILRPVTDSIDKYCSAPAFYINGIFYTYEQFADRISAIRVALECSPSANNLIALAIHDDIDTYASIFAIWMNGLAYVPLHPNQPMSRNLSILSQIESNIILDSAKESVFEEWENKDDRKIICTSDFQAKSKFINSWKECKDEELAYILFTSGSTGAPKGVAISRKNIATFIDSFWKSGIYIHETDKCLQCFDLTFDVSVQSYLVALQNGACVYTVPYGQVKYIYAASLIHNQGITFGAMAPSMLTYLRPYFKELDASSLRQCILTAEACPIDLIEDWLECAKNVEVYDFYGPTETTIYCTFYPVSRKSPNLSHNGIISIGKPMANVNAIIINDAGDLVQGEEKGELCIAGDQVTPGYWKNEEKNTSSFFIRDGIRYYHTGDLCYWERNTHNIMYSGRIDQQAKIQGFRVELGEIEYHARHFFNNERRVVAIAFQNENRLTEIALFVEANTEDCTELINYLKSQMPTYMIPAIVRYINPFPLNKSEKIDRNSLKKYITNDKR